MTAREGRILEVAFQGHCRICVWGAQEGALEVSGVVVHWNGDSGIIPAHLIHFI